MLSDKKKAALEKARNAKLQKLQEKKQPQQRVQPQPQIVTINANVYYPDHDARRKGTNIIRINGNAYVKLHPAGFMITGNLNHLRAKVTPLENYRLEPELNHAHGSYAWFNFLQNIQSSPRPNSIVFYATGPPQNPAIINDVQQHLRNYPLQNFKALENPMIKLPEFSLVTGALTISEVDALAVPKGNKLSIGATKNIEYLKANYQPNKCVITALLFLHKSQIDQYRNSGTTDGKASTTYDYIETEVMGLKENEIATIEHLVKFHEKFRIELTVYDIFGEIIRHFEPQKLASKFGSKHNKFILLDHHLFLGNVDTRNRERAEDQKMHLLEETEPKKPKAKKTAKYNVDLITKGKPKQRILTDSLEEVLKLTGDVDIVYQGDMVKLLYDLWQKKIIPRVHATTAGIHQIKIKGITVTQEHTGHLPVHYESIEQYDLASELGLKVKKALLTHRYRSDYNAFLNSVFQIPRANYVDIYQESKGKPLSIIDFHRFYTAMFFNHLKQIPVFSEFDMPTPFEGPIEQYTIYLVEGNDSIYLDQKVNPCFGFSLEKYAKTNDVKIIAQIRPHKLEPMSSQLLELGRTIYSTDFKENTEKIRKNIFNICIGLTGKKRSKVEQCFVGTLEDCQIHSARDDNRGQIHALTPTYELEATTIDPNDENVRMLHEVLPELKDIKPSENFDLFMYVREKTYDLVNGFYPIQLFVYDCARFELQNLKDQVSAVTPVYAVNTDAVYIETSEVQKVRAKFPTLFVNETLHPFERIGLLRTEDNCRPSRTKPTIQKEMDFPTPDFTLPVQTNFEFTAEQEWDTPFLTEKALEILQTNRISLDGHGGCGKSTLCKAVAKTFGKRALFVPPTHELRSGFESGDFDAKTACSLLRLFPRHGQLVMSHENKPVKCTGYDFIVFDEILLNPVRVFAAISEFIRFNPHVKIMCTYGRHQLDGMEKLNARAKEYKLRIVQKLFSANMILKVCKRGDGKILNWVNENLHGCIRGAATTPLDQAIDAAKKTFKIVHSFSELPKDVQYCVSLSHFGCKNFQRYLRLYDRMTPEIEKRFRAIQRHSVMPTADDAKKKILIQNGDKFDLFSQTDRSVVLENINTKVHHQIAKDDFHKFYTLDVAKTILSAQGLTIDKPYVIVGINSRFFCKDALYVALTRTTAMENIYILDAESTDKCVIETRIEAHKQADQKANREFKIEEYVDVDWMIENFPSQCRYCCVALTIDNASIDRKDNHIAHLKQNCEIICRDCNVKKSDEMI